MKAGRQLDALVYRKVFSPDFEYTGDVPPVVPAYSTEISAAWEVVEKVGGMVLIPIAGWEEPDARQAGGWYAAVEEGFMYWDYMAVGPKGGDDYGPTHRGYFARTAPLAICRAALQAVGAETPA